MNAGQIQEIFNQYSQHYLHHYKTDVNNPLSHSKDALDQNENELRTTFEQTATKFLTSSIPLYDDLDKSGDRAIATNFLKRSSESYKVLKELDP